MDNVVNAANASPSRPLVGLFPAGGHASRIAPLPCSKELYPIGFRATNESGETRAKVVSHYLLESWRLAGVRQAYVILRPEKWDIPQYFGDGTLVNMNLAYLMTGLPYGTPYTLDQAYPFIEDAMIVFGFPDIVFRPAEAYQQLLARQVETGADVVLGIFPAHQPHKMDMVDRTPEGEVRLIEIKPAQTQLRYTWILAVWTPVLTHFMHEFLPTICHPEDREVFVGHVFQAAMQNGIHINSVTFPLGTYLDIGTPDDLARAVQAETAQWVRPLPDGEN